MGFFIFFLSQSPKKERWKEKLTIQKTLLLFVSLRWHIKMSSAFLCEEAKCSTHPAYSVFHPRPQLEPKYIRLLVLDCVISAELDMWQKNQIKLNK